MSRNPSRNAPTGRKRAPTPFCTHVNALIDGAQARGIPIVRVFHTDGPQEAGNPFAHGSEFIRPLTGLAPFEAALTIDEASAQRAGGHAAGASGWSRTASGA